MNEKPMFRPESPPSGIDQIVHDALARIHEGAEPSAATEWAVGRVRTLSEEDQFTLFPEALAARIRQQAKALLRAITAEAEQTRRV